MSKPDYFRRFAIWNRQLPETVFVGPTMVAGDVAGKAVHVAPALLDYVQALIAATRAKRELALGLSPRAAQGLLRAARAWALIAGRNSVIPDDVQAVWPAIASHRLQFRDAGQAGSGRRRDAAHELLESVPVPA